MFNLVSKYNPSGNQPKAISELVKGWMLEKASSTFVSNWYW